MSDALGIGNSAFVGNSPSPRAGIARAAWQSLAQVGKWQHLALTAIMIMAVTLRMVCLDVVEFKLDEVQPLALADQVWREHRLPLTYGQSSTGLPETPLIGYLLVLPRILSADPRLGAGFIALLDCLAVLLTYFAVRRFAGERLALLSAALYAVNPWAVVFSRKTWAEILPLFTVLILWAAYEVVLRRKPAWALLFFPLLALQVQAHVMGALFLLPALLTMAIFLPRWRNRYTLWSIALGMLILLPYGLVLARQWGATKAVLRSSSGQGLIVDLRALIYGFYFASGATITALMGRSARVLQTWEQALRAANVATAGLMVWAIGLSGWALARRRAGWERQALLLIWLAGPLVPLVFVRGALGIHYLLLLVPALFVLVGMSWERLLRSTDRAVVLGTALALAAVLAIQGSAVLAVYDGVTCYPTEGGFGRPLRFWQQVQEGVQASASAQGWRELSVLGTDDGSWSEERAVLDYLLGRRMRLRYVGRGGKRGVVVPAEGETAALVLADDEEMLRTVTRFGEEWRRWPGRSGDPAIKLFRLRPHDHASIARDMTLARPASYNNGMRLLGARLPARVRPGGRLSVVAYWTYTGRAPNTNPADTAFYHLLDHSGRRWAQYDGFALSRSEWRAGETLLEWFDITLPADLPLGDYQLYTGMYSWRDMSRAQVQDEDGRVVGDGVRLGPITTVAGP